MPCIAEGHGSFQTVSLIHLLNFLLFFPALLPNSRLFLVFRVLYCATHVDLYPRMHACDIMRTRTLAYDTP